MKRGDAFPSRFVSKDDLAQPKIVTIGDVEMQEIQGDGGKENKPVMHFTDFDKPLILNNINWQTCEDVYGDDSDAWRGKKIQLYHDPSIMFGNKRVGGVRIRLPQVNSTVGGTASQWSWPQALQQAGEVGLDEAGLKEALKARGLNGYNAQRDTAVVREILNERRKESAFVPEGEGVEADSIPF